MRTSQLTFDFRMLPGSPRLLSTGEWRSTSLPESEVTARSTLHDGLAARQFELAVEARDHGKVPIAVHAKAESGQAKLVIELGVAAARDIEIEMMSGFRKDLDIQAAAAGPDLLRHLSQRRGRLPVAFRPPRAIFGGELANGDVDHFARGLLAEFFAQRLDERNQHAAFDLASLQVRNGNVARITGIRFSHGSLAWSPRLVASRGGRRAFARTHAPNRPRVKPVFRRSSPAQMPPA